MTVLIGCQQEPEPITPLPATPPSSPNQASSEPDEKYIPDQIIVKFKQGTPIEAQQALNESLGTTVIHTSPSAGFIVLQIAEGKTVEEMVALYSEQSIVEYAEPNYIEHTSPGSP